MAHFAKIGINNLVEQVIVINNSEIIDENGIEQESLGQTFINSLFGTNDIWKQTSYNGNIRKNFASAGFEYDQTRDAFIPPRPYNSWILNEDTCRWEAPVTYPNDGQDYRWNETVNNWELI